MKKTIIYIIAVFAINANAQLLSKGELPPQNTPIKKAKPAEIAENKPDVKFDSALENYNYALKLHKEGKVDDAIKYYEIAINKAKNYSEIRGKAYQNLGVIYQQKTKETPQQGDVDKLDESLDKQKDNLLKAENMYRESVRYSQNNEYLKNQQILLNNQKKILDIKKLIQAFRFLQKEAIKNTKESKANGEIEKARKSVEDYKNIAKMLQQKEVEKNAGLAEEELKKAVANKTNSAKHIDQALKYLQPPKKDNKDKNKDDKKKKDDKDKKDPDDKDKKDQKKKKQDKDQKDQKKKDSKDDKNKKDDKLDKNKKTQKGKEEKVKDKEISKKEAEKLLNLMAEKEKEFREKVKEYKNLKYKGIEVEKDW